MHKLCDNVRETHERLQGSAEWSSCRDAAGHGPVLQGLVLQVLQWLHYHILPGIGTALSASELCTVLGSSCCFCSHMLVQEMRATAFDVVQHCTPGLASQNIVELSQYVRAQQPHNESHPVEARQQLR